MMSKFNVTYKHDQKQLLKCLEDGDLAAFKNLLRNKDRNNIDPNHEYCSPHYKTCLAIASQKGMVKFIEVLLANNADPNQICKIHNGNAPIHFAAENGQFDAVKCLVQHPATIVSIINRKGETALHLSARSLTKCEKAEACFSYLASLPGMSVSHTSVKGVSAVSEAVKKFSRNTLQEVLQRRDLRPEDRECILSKHPELKDEAPDSIEITYSHYEAYMDLRHGNFGKFKCNLKKEFVNRTDLIQMTLLQLACEKGLLDVVELLLSCEADVNKTGTHESRPPVYLACYYGHYDILKHLFKTGKVKVGLTEGKTLLHAVFEGLRANRDAPDSFCGCFDFLLQKHKTLNIPINEGDGCGHTALHYAAQEDNDHFAKALIARGAYMGSLNNFGICPLKDIDPEILETALNGCVKRIRGKESGEYTLNIDFKILNPTAECDREGQDDAESRGRSQGRSPEMFPLHFISQSNKLGHLLKHPVLQIFLHMKWSRVRMGFYLNMLLYIIFVILLTSYILSESNMCDECQNNSECNKREVNGLRVFLILLSVALVLKELLICCMTQQKCGFFYGLKNFLGLGIIIATVLIPVCKCPKLLAAVTLLLAWTEVILQLGCIFALAIYNEMLKRVTVNYFKILLWSSPLIIAFTFSFYKVYHNETSSEVKGSNYSARNSSSEFSVQNNTVKAYSNIQMSVLKTVVMMVGEFDASNMTFNLEAYFVFLSFVFMMTIVFMNLLHGIAVSDIQAIRKEAELVAYKSRVKLVHDFESISFGGPAQGSRGYELVGRSPYFWRVWQEKLLRRISLFPDVLSHGSLEITVKKETRYRAGNIKDKDVEFRPDTRFTIGEYRIGSHVDIEVIEACKDIAERTRRESEHKSSQIENKLAKIEEDIRECKERFETLEGLLKQPVNSKCCCDRHSNR
jgi:ankyrin repeat protein